jgi:TP901 family phage tail tape measure protein
MTAPGGGGGRNLNPLWVPLLGEASQLIKTAEDAAHKARQAFTTAAHGIGDPLHQGISEGMRQAADDMDQHSKRGANAVQQNLGQVAGRVAALWTEGFHLAEEGFDKILDLGKEAAAQFVEISETWENVTRTLRARTTATGEDLENLQNTVATIGRNTSVGFQSIAEAVGVLHQRTGLGGEALKQLATDVVDAQKVFGQPIDVNRFTGAVRAYGGSMEDADKILNQLANTSRATGTPMNELIESVYRGGPTMRQFGVEIGPATALMAQMSEHGIRSQSAIFALNRSMTEAAKAGMPFEEFLKNSVQRVKDLYDVGNEGGAQDLAIKIFGARGGSSIASAIEDGALSVEMLNQAFTDMGDTGTEKISDIYDETKTLQDRFEELKHGVADSLRPFTEHLLGEVSPALNHLAEWMGSHESVMAGFFVRIGDIVGATAQGIVEVTARSVEGVSRLLPFLAEIDRAGANVAEFLGKDDYADKSRKEADRLDDLSKSWAGYGQELEKWGDRIGRSREQFRGWGSELTENLKVADTFNQVLESTPDGKQMEFRTNAPDVKAQLDELGLNMQMLQDKDHTLVITASTEEAADRVKEWAKATEAHNIKVVTLPNPKTPQGQTWDSGKPEEAFPGIEKGIPVPVVPIPSTQGGPGGPAMPPAPGPGMPGPPGPGAPFGAPPTNVSGVPATPGGLPGGPGPMPPMPGPGGGAPAGHPAGPAAPAAPAGPPAAPGTPTGESETVSEMFGNWQRLTKPDGGQWWVNHDDKDEDTGQAPIIDPQSLKPPEGWMWMQTAPHVNVLTRTGKKAGTPPARPAYTARPGQGPINNQPVPPGPVGSTSGSGLLDREMGLPDWYTRLQRLLGGGINNPMNNPQTVPGTSVGSDGRTYQIMEQGFSQPMTALPPSAASPGGRPPINLPPDQDNPGVNRLLAWQIYNQMGMPLDQWDDFERLEMSEAGYRATAKNPGSTAYGMGQFLDSTFRDYGQPPTGTADPAVQLQLMMQYLKNRYHGSPSEAWRFHLANDYYAQGSWVSGGAGGIDDVPAWLTEGEFVVRKESAQKWAPVLEWINTHGHGNPPQLTRGFEKGDEVTNPVSPFTGGQIDPSMYSSTQEFIHAWNLARFLGETMTGHADGGEVDPDHDRTQAWYDEKFRQQMVYLDPDHMSGFQGGGEVDPHDYGFTPEMFGSLEEYRNWYRLHGLIQHIEHMGYQGGGHVFPMRDPRGVDPHGGKTQEPGDTSSVGPFAPWWDMDWMPPEHPEKVGPSIPGVQGKWWHRGPAPGRSTFRFPPIGKNRKNVPGDPLPPHDPNDPHWPTMLGGALGYADGGLIGSGAEGPFDRAGQMKATPGAQFNPNLRLDLSHIGVPHESDWMLQGLGNPYNPTMNSAPGVNFLPKDYYNWAKYISRIGGGQLPSGPARVPTGHALGGWIRGFQGGGAVATDTGTSSKSATSGAYIDPNSPDVVDWMKQMVDMYNASTGSNLQITADRSGYAGNEPGDVGHPNEGGSSLHDVNRAVDIGGPAEQRAAFLRWWESDPNRVKATRQLIASGLPGMTPASTNIYAGDLYSHNGQDIPSIYGQDTLSKHGDHIHLGLEGVPLFSPGMGAPPANAGSVPYTSYQPSQYPGYVVGPDGKVIPQSQATGYGNYGGATQQEIESAGKAVEQARQHMDDLTTAASEADEDVKRLQTTLDDVTQKRVATDEQISDAQAKAAKAHREQADAVNAYNDATGKQTEILNKPPDLSDQKLRQMPGANHIQAFGGSLISGLLQGLGFDNDVFSNPLDWGIWKLFTGGANYAGGLLKGMGKEQTGMFAPPGSPQADPLYRLKGPFSAEGNPLSGWGGLLGMIPGIQSPLGGDQKPGPNSPLYQDPNSNAGIASAVTPNAGLSGPFGPPTGPAPGPVAPVVDASVNISYPGTVNQGLPSAEAVTSAMVTQSRAPGNAIVQGGPVLR